MSALSRLGIVAAVIGMAASGDVDAAGAAPPTSGVVLAPHRAVYEITLDQSRGGSGVSDVNGRMVYELTGSPCDGFTQNMRLVTRTTNQDGVASMSDMRSSSWEDGLAKIFRFNSSQYKDAKLEDSTHGDVAREGTSSAGKVELTKPQKKALPLKRDVLFPAQHSIALLAAAQQGAALFQADLYDGSEKGEKVYFTTSIIAKPRPAGFNKALPRVTGAEALDNVRAWPVSISYFEAGSDKKDATPTYETAYIYYENGVSRKLFFDYGDFAIRGTLKEITFLEPSKCDQSAQKK